MSEKNPKPWFDKPPTLKHGSKIAIIGGGISGLMMAWHLSNYFDVILIEEKKSIMSGASGNPAAILDPYIALNQSIEKKFYLKAYEYAVDFYCSLPSNIFHKCGLLKVPKDNKEQVKFNKISNQYSSSILQKTETGLFFPNAGYINPKKLGEHLSKSLKILLKTKVTKITNSNYHKWKLINDNDNIEIEVDAVIISNSYNSYHLEQANEIILEKISGQISYVKSEKAIDQVYCAKGYLTPMVETEFGFANICGATFDRDNFKEISDSSHNENIQKSPISITSTKILGGRREIRAMTNDHLPICGALPIFDEYRSLYEGLRHGPSHKDFSSASYHNGLYISAGLGSRGFLTAPILGLHMTSIIRGKRSPLDTSLQHALHPARFLIRILSKK